MASSRTSETAAPGGCASSDNMKRREITRALRAGTGSRSGTIKGSFGRSRFSVSRNSSAARPRLRNRSNKTSQRRFRINPSGSSEVRASSNSILSSKCSASFRSFSGRETAPRASLCRCTPCRPRRTASSLDGSRASSPNVWIPQRRSVACVSSSRGSSATFSSFSRAPSVPALRIVMPPHPRAAKTAASGLDAIPT
jgi:hypothetical protein